MSLFSFPCRVLQRAIHVFFLSKSSNHSASRSFEQRNHALKDTMEVKQTGFEFHMFTFLSDFVSE